MKFNRRFSRAQVKSRRLQVQTLCRACASACDVGLYMSDLFLSSELVPAPPSVWETEHNFLKYDLPVSHLYHHRRMAEPRAPNASAHAAIVRTRHLHGRLHPRRPSEGNRTRRPVARG